MAKTDLSAERARALLEYDPATGSVTRKFRVSNSSVGKPIGTLSYGRLVATIDYHVHLVHRLAWLLHYGEWPKGVIDHINGDPTDNRISNLRDVDQATNMQNIRRPTRINTSGFLGVSRNHNKFRASMRIEGRWKFLGNFDTPEEAHAAYLSAKRKHHAGCTL